MVAVRKQMNLHAAIKEIYGSEAECDGILNPSLYDAAPLRILWLLREPWFTGAWKLLKGNGVYSRIGGSPTLHPIIYVTYSIFHGFPRWRDMDWIRDDPVMAEVLRSIAYINVKKCAGGTASNLQDIYDWFKKGEGVIRQQVCDCTPDVIVGCRPYMRDLFRWDSSRSRPVEEAPLSFVSDPDKPLLVEAPHPSWRGGRGIYVDSIVSAVEREVGRKPKHNVRRPR